MRQSLCTRPWRDGAIRSTAARPSPSCRTRPEATSSLWSGSSRSRGRSSAQAPSAPPCSRGRDGRGERARVQLERPLRAAELAEQLVMRPLPLAAVERRQPPAGGADEATEGLPELVEVPVAGGHVQLGGLDLAVGSEQVVNLLRRSVPA